MKNHFFIVILLLISSFTICAQIPDSSSKEKTDELFYVVDVAPDYPGGVPAILAFIQSNILYPKEALDKGIQGTVFVTFFVEVDGSLTNIKAARGIGGGCDEEAIRVISIMPKWKPGILKNKNTRVSMYLPIKFDLPKNKSKSKK